MVVAQPWQRGDVRRCRELGRCGCSEIRLGSGGQAAKTGPSPAPARRGGKDVPRDGRGDSAQGSVLVQRSWPRFAAFPRLSPGTRPGLPSWKTRNLYS